MRRRTCCAAWILAASVVVPPVSALAQEATAPAAPEIEAVRFLGASSLSRSVLLSAIKTRPTQCRTPLAAPLCLLGDFEFAEIKQFLRDTAQVTADAERLKTLYETWGFPDAKVSGRILPQPDGDVIVEFEIDEGQPIRIRSIAVRGLEAFVPPIELPHPLPLAPGEPYALPRLESTLQVIRARLAERGYATPQIEISGDVDRATRSATLVLDVDPGAVARFGEITIQAVRPLTESIVRKALVYRPGERFRPSAIEQTERRLYALPITERAAVLAAPIQPGDTLVPTTVVAEPRRVSGFGFEGTLSSTDCLTLAGRWSNRSFLGGARLLLLGVAVSNLFAAQLDGAFPCTNTGTGEFTKLQGSVHAELWQPALFGDFRWTGTLSAFARRFSAPNVYIQRGYGGRIAVARELRPDMAVRLSWAPERNALDASSYFFCATYGVCSAAGIDRFTELTWLAPVELALLWASAPVPLARPPETGPGTPWRPNLTPDWRFTTRITPQAAGDATGSEYVYARPLGEVTATRVVGRSFELASRVRLGALYGDDVLPPQVRFYSGGVNTVRGVPENQLGPAVLVARNPDRLPCGNGIEPPCDGQTLDPDLFSIRPLGGQRVAEANVEARWWLSDHFQFAAFLDFGTVQSGDAGCLPDAICLAAATDSRLTPGIGVRLFNDIGPIRLDLGFDPGGSRLLPLLRRTEDGGVADAGTIRFDPYGWDNPGWFKEFVRRLQVQMAIGQAF